MNSFYPKTEGVEFERPEGEMPEGAEPPAMPEGEVPALSEGGERPKMPQGGEYERPEGEIPKDFKKFEGEKSQGGRGGRDPGMGMEGIETAGEPSSEFVLSKESYQFGGITVKE